MGYFFDLSVLDPPPTPQSSIAVFAARSCRPHTHLLQQLARLTSGCCNRRQWRIAAWADVVQTPAAEATGFWNFANERKK